MNGVVRPVRDETGASGRPLPTVTIGISAHVMTIPISPLTEFMRGSRGIITELGGTFGSSAFRAVG